MNLLDRFINTLMEIKYLQKLSSCSIFSICSSNQHGKLFSAKRDTVPIILGLTTGAISYYFFLQKHSQYKNQMKNKDYNSAVIAAEYTACATVIALIFYLLNQLRNTVTTSQPESSPDKNRGEQAASLL